MPPLNIGSLTVDRSRLAEVCQKWGIGSVAAFGSVLRGDFNAESDIDLLIEYLPGIRHSFFSYDAMQNDFVQIFGRAVDLVHAEGIKNSRNPLRRQHILSSAVPIYNA
jgi:uncharacterized protein